jgi:hypothetical protein
MEVLSVFLKPGWPANLEGIGTFRVSVTSDGTATLEELNARTPGALNRSFCQAST